MKAQVKIQNNPETGNARYIFIGLLIIMLQALFHLYVDASTKGVPQKDATTPVAQKVL